MKNYYIGIMSGTSLDGVDAVLAEISATGQAQVLQHVDIPMDSSLRKTYFGLQKPSENALHLEALAANQLALHYAQAVEKCLTKTTLSPQDIQAIGAHGQTIRHQPGLHDGIGYTRQSLNPSLLAEKSGIDVIADFRSRDIAAGGQGAPLVPAFHWAQFAQTKALAVLNIGGISHNADLLITRCQHSDCNNKKRPQGRFLLAGFFVIRVTKQTAPRTTQQSPKPLGALLCADL